MGIAFGKQQKCKARAGRCRTIFEAHTQSEGERAIDRGRSREGGRHKGAIDQHLLGDQVVPGLRSCDEDLRGPLLSHMTRRPRMISDRSERPSVRQQAESLICLPACPVSKIRGNSRQNLTSARRQCWHHCFACIASREDYSSSKKLDHCFPSHLACRGKVTPCVRVMASPGITRCSRPWENYRRVESHVACIQLHCGSINSETYSDRKGQGAHPQADPHRSQLPKCR